MGFKQFFMKNLPTILTVTGVAAVGATVFFAIKVTPEATRRINKLKKDKEADVFAECEDKWLEDHGYTKGGDNEGEDPDDAELFTGASAIMEKVPDKSLRPNPKDVIKEVAPLYIPTVLMCGASVACFVAANSISVQRLTATSAALTATEEAFRTYKNKVIEQIGEKKAEEVLNRVTKQKMDEHPVKSDIHPNGSKVILTGDGDTLCFDEYSGRWFRTDIDKINRSINVISHDILREDWISLNELYDELNLPQIKLGENIGWNVMDGCIEPRPYSEMTEHGEPVYCLRLDPEPHPIRYKYGDGVW